MSLSAIREEAVKSGKTSADVRTYLDPHKVFLGHTCGVPRSVCSRTACAINGRVASIARDRSLLKKKKTKKNKEEEEEDTPLDASHVGGYLSETVRVHTAVDPPRLGVRESTGDRALSDRHPTCVQRILNMHC